MILYRREALGSPPVFRSDANGVNHGRFNRTSGAVPTLVDGTFRLSIVRFYRPSGARAAARVAVAAVAACGRALSPLSITFYSVTGGSERKSVRFAWSTWTTARRSVVVLFLIYCTISTSACRPSLHPSVRPSDRSTDQTTDHPSVGSSVRSSVRLSIRRSVRHATDNPLVHPPVYSSAFILFVHSSFHSYARQLDRLSVRPSICPPVRPSVHLSVCQSVNPSVRLTVRPSVHSSARRPVHSFFHIRAFRAPKNETLCRYNYRMYASKCPLETVAVVAAAARTAAVSLVRIGIRLLLLNILEHFLQ